MSEPTTSPAALLNAWNTPLEAYTCEHCHWSFLAASTTQLPCPHCHQARLVPIPEYLPELAYPYPPELILPFSVSTAAVEDALRAFSKGIPFPPDDLNLAVLRTRLAPLFLPQWLIDARVDATWEAEAGFDYAVVSHQESFNQDSNHWQTREINEARIRWENRVGRIYHAYQNVVAPALDDASQLTKLLGDFHTDKSLPYQPEQIARAFVRLPDHTPEETWSEATTAFQKTAADECRTACAAAHLRQFSWKAELSQINWTLMLLPAFSSYYLDDKGLPQTILLHGQTGHISGARRASMRKASGASLTFFLAGIILFLLGLILDNFSAASAAISLVSLALILGGIGSGIAALFPILTAWDFNHKNS
jgi:hypothetical protein